MREISLMCRLVYLRYVAKSGAKAIRVLEWELPLLEYPAVFVRIAAKLYRTRKDFDSACRVYEMYIDRVHAGLKTDVVGISSVMIDYANFQIACGNFSKAVKILEELLKLFPHLIDNNEAMKTFMVDLCTNAGQHDKAIAYRAGKPSSPEFN